MDGPGGAAEATPGPAGPGASTGRARAAGTSGRPAAAPAGDAGPAPRPPGAATGRGGSSGGGGRRPRRRGPGRRVHVGVGAVAAGVALAAALAAGRAGAIRAVGTDWKPRGAEDTQKHDLLVWEKEEALGTFTHELAPGHREVQAAAAFALGAMNARSRARLSCSDHLGDEGEHCGRGQAAKLTAVDYPVLVKSRLGMTLYNMKMRIRFRNEATGAPELKVVSSIVLHDMGGGFTVMREKVLGSQVVPGR